MLYAIEEANGKFTISDKYHEKSASDLNLLEKTIENWIAANPALLFPKEEVFVFGQSIAGHRMADLLALDALGNLIIVEIKRDWSDRSTVAQLLEYAAIYKDADYGVLNQLAGDQLIEKFRIFIDRPDFPESKIGKKQRVFIVAPDSDLGLKKIVNWLRAYGVPIEFIPFRLLADKDNKPRLIDIAGVSTDAPTEQLSADSPDLPDSWAGHWIFNTNESYAEGAYQRMLKEGDGVIAIYGYDNGGRNLEGSTVGNKVLAYVNKKGLMAIGEITDPKVQLGAGIFFDEHGKQQPDEYHVKVKWTMVLPGTAALSSSEASKMGYNLPVRSVFAHLWNGRLAGKLEQEIKRRYEKLKSDGAL